MIRTCLYAVTGLAALVLLAIAALFTMDLGVLKAPAQQWLSEFLEREIAVDGELEVHLGRDIRIRGRNFRLASPDWSEHPNMVEVDEVEGRVNLSSLLNWPIQIHAVRATGVRVYLENRKDAPANWVFWPDEPDTPDDNERFTWPIMIDDTVLQEVSLHYQSPDRRAPLVIRADNLSEKLANDGIEASLSGQLNQTPLELSLRGETVAEIVQMRKTQFSWTGNLGEVNFKGNLALQDLTHPKRPTAQLELKGPSVEYLTDRLGIDRVSSGPLALDFSIAPTAERMQVTIDGRFGEFVILTSGQFSDLQRLSNLDLRLSASGPSAENVGKLADIQGIPDQPFSINTLLQRRDSRLDIEGARVTVGQTQFDLSGRVEDFHRPGSATATLDITGPDLGTFGQLLGLPGKLGGPFSVEVDVAPGSGGANVTGTVKTSLLALQTTGVLSRKENLAGSQFTVNATMDSIAKVADLLDLSASFPSIPAELDLDLDITEKGYAIRESELRIADDRMNVTGLVGPTPTLSGTQLDVLLKIPQPRATLEAFGVDGDDIAADDLQLKAVISEESDRWQFRNVDVRFGQLTAELDGELARLDSLDGATASLLLRGPDLAAHLPKVAVMAGMNHAFQLRSDAKIDGTTIQLNGRFDIDKTHLEGTASIPFDAAVPTGSFDLSGESPDVLKLAPNPENIQPGQVAPLSLKARGNWADNLFRFEDIDLKVGESRLRVRGDLQGPPNFERTDLRMEASVHDLSRLGPLVGWDLPQHNAQASFTLDGTPNVLTLSNLSIKSGNSDISGSAALRYGEIPDLTINLQSSLLDLTHYLPSETDETAEQTAVVEAQPAPSEGDDRFIPDTPIDISALERFSGKFDVAIGELVLRHRSISHVTLDASIQQGVLRVARAAYTGEDDGKLEARGSLRPGPDGVRLALRTVGDNLNIGLPALSADDLSLLPRYRVELALLTVGDTVRQMAAAANGYIELESGPGKVKSGSMQMLTNDFLDQLISTLNPFQDKDPYNEIECITLLAAIEKGQLEGAPLLVIQSKRLNMFSEASVDLSSEKLVFTFQTVPQRGLGLSLSNLVNPYVQVIGTLGDPKLSLNPEGTLLQGGAAVATGGLSILAIGFKDRFLSSKTPCADAMESARGRFDELDLRYGGLGTAPGESNNAPIQR